jgi:Fibronectin type III domain.
MATVPGRPGPFVITSYTNTRVNGDADPGDDGGSPILEWQLAWGTHPTTATDTGTLSASGSGFVTPLVPGGTYYFWNRQRNAVGWGPLSPMTQVTMRDAPDPPKAPSLFSFKTQTSVKVLISPNSDNGSRITTYELAYGLSPSSTATSIEDDQPLIALTNLDPGETYYLWAKAKNAYGESDWSARGVVELIAGARVKVGPVWKRAVPYVKVSGVWKMARPWIRSSGVWKESAD